MFRRHFLLILLAASIGARPALAHAQTSAKPQVVLPPLHTIQPLEVGPPRVPKDEIELPPTPPDYEVEHPFLVSITVFKEEPLPGDQIHGTDPSSRRYYTSITYVSTDGTMGSTAWWGYADLNSNGGPLVGATRLPPDSFARIKALIATLPNDHGRIPPRNRKVQVAIATRHGTETWMYDAANLPEPVLEIFRLTDTSFTPVVPQFSPDLAASRSEQEPGGAAALLAVSHDRRLSVVFPWQLNLIDVTAWLEQDIACHHDQQSCPGDNWDPLPQVVDASGRIVFKVPPVLDSSSTQFRAAWFTPDDRYLVFSTRIPAIRIYDTRNWQQVAQIPAIPAGSTDFEPSPNWKRAVVAFPSGEIDLWDVVSGRRLSRMDFGRELPNVAWAPDSRGVAIYTPGQYSSTSRFGIWDAQTGHLEHEILPVEPPSWWFNGAPLWWPDGRYLLMSTSGMIGVWNVESGLYRGSFTDACQARNSILHLDKGHLIMDCEGRSPIVWDADSAIHAVVAFEASLNAEK